MEVLRAQRAVPRGLQMRSAASLCRYAIAQHQSTFTTNARKVLRAKLDSRNTLASCGLQIPPVQSRLGIQVRALQTTTQPPVDGTFTIPANATTAQVTELLASFRSEVERTSQSKSKRRELAAREHLGARAFEWMKQLEALDQQLAISKDFCWRKAKRAL